MELKFKSLLSVIFIYLSFTALISCKESYTPKQRGYIRVIYPQKSYLSYIAPQGFGFEYPSYSLISTDSTNRHPEWLNIEFPQFDAKIYLSYIRINGDPGKNINESRDLAYKHSIKAEAINETLINIPEKNIYGIFYDIKGNAASSVQFFITDSLKNFLRGSLYFNAEPNQDSLGPIIQFIREDVDHFIKTIDWQPQHK